MDVRKAPGRPKVREVFGRYRMENAKRAKSTILKGSGHDRIMECRRDLTLDVFTRYGQFWKAIGLLRDRWGIYPSTEVPHFSTAYQCPGSPLLFYTPTAWPTVLPPSPLPDTWPDFWHILEVIPGEVLQIDPRSVALGTPHPLIEWYVDLKRLHDLRVPESARIPPMPYREGPWVSFLSACVLNDPPSDRLRDFAHHLLPEIFARSVRGGGIPTSESLMPDGLQQVGSPVVYLEDAQEIEALFETRFAEVWAFFHEYVSITREVDVNELLSEAIEARPSEWQEIWDRFGDRIANVTKRAYIAVEPSTTRDDVTDAFKVLKRGFPPRSKGRPERDRLICVQTAVWFDQFGMSNQEIARRLGWRLSRRDGAKDRSERVREHIEEGRLVLALRKPAA